MPSQHCMLPMALQSRPFPSPTLLLPAQFTLATSSPQIFQISDKMC